MPKFHIILLSIVFLSACDSLKEFFSSSETGEPALNENLNPTDQDGEVPPVEEEKEEDTKKSPAAEKTTSSEGDKESKKSSLVKKRATKKAPAPPITPPSAPVKKIIVSEEDSRILIVKEAFDGNVKAVKRLLGKIHDINAQNSLGETVFSKVAEQTDRPNNLEIMVLLVSWGADPNLPDNKGNTPLINAVLRGEIKAVRQLLKVSKIKRGINTQNKKGETAFFKATEKSEKPEYQKIMELLLDAEADPNLPNSKGNTPLLQAVQDTRTGTVRRLLEIPKIKENITADEGNIVLQFVARNGEIRITEQLLAISTVADKIKEADFRDLLKKYMRFDETVTSASRQKIRDLFEKAGAPSLVLPEASGGSTPLMKAVHDWAINSGHTDTSTVEQLLEIPAVKNTINYTDKTGRTAFVVALQSYPKHINLLLSNGADPVLSNKFGNTLLMKYIKGSYGSYGYSFGVVRVVKVVKDFLTIPAVRETINNQNDDGETAFSIAVKNYGQYNFSLGRHRSEAAEDIMSQIMDLLVEAGADPHLPDEDGNTLLMRSGSHIKTVDRLVKIPAVRENINVPNKERETVLLQAAKNKRDFKILLILAKAGANPVLPLHHEVPNRFDTYGHTLLMYLVDEIYQTRAAPDPVEYGTSRDYNYKDAGRQRIIGVFRDLLAIPAVKESVNARNKQGNTALEIAVSYHPNPIRDEMKDLLLSKGADPNLPDENGNTFLMRAVLWNRIHAVRGFLSISSVMMEKINSANNEGKTVLSLAQAVQENLNISWRKYKETLLEHYFPGQVDRYYHPTEERLKNKIQESQDIIDLLLSNGASAGTDDSDKSGQRATGKKSLHADSKQKKSTTTEKIADKKKISSQTNQRRDTAQSNAEKISDQKTLNEGIQDQSGKEISSKGGFWGKFFSKLKSFIF